MGGLTDAIPHTDPWLAPGEGESIDEVFKVDRDPWRTHNTTWKEAMSTTKHTTLAAALAAFQAEMPTVHKAHEARVRMKDGGTFGYTYAALPDVTAAVMPLLSKHGLSFSVCPDVTDDRAVVRGILLHADTDQRLEAALPLFGRTAQEIGSSLTYARRYLLGCMTGVVTDDDDDGDRADAAPRTEPEPLPMTDKTRRQLFALFTRKGVPEEQQLAGINAITGRAYESRGALTEDDAQRVIAVLQQKPDAEVDRDADHAAAVAAQDAQAGA